MWRKGVLEAEGFPVERVSDYLEQPDTLVWADLCLPDRNDLHQIAEELGLAPLAVEDAVESHERPKLDRYPTHLFLFTYGMSFTPDQQLVVAPVSAFTVPRNAALTEPTRRSRHITRPVSGKVPDAR